jgi:hypothetical protein
MREHLCWAVAQNPSVFRPHLNITLDEIDTGFEMIERAIQKL